MWNDLNRKTALFLLLAAVLYLLLALFTQSVWT